MKGSHGRVGSSSRGSRRRDVMVGKERRGIWREDGLCCEHATIATTKRGTEGGRMEKKKQQRVGGKERGGRGGIVVVYGVGVEVGQVERECCILPTAQYKPGSSA